MKAHVCPMLDCTASFNEARQLERHMQHHFSSEAASKAGKGKSTKKGRSGGADRNDPVDPVSWGLAEQLKARLGRLEAFGITVTSRTIRARGVLIASSGGTGASEQVLVRWVAATEPQGEAKSPNGIRVCDDQWLAKGKLPRPLEKDVRMSQQYYATLLRHCGSLASSSSS